MSKKPELLAPASSPEVLKTAIRYGADAVYIGGEQYGLRAKAKNFSDEAMRECIEYAHERDKKIYVTANITAHDRDLTGVRDYFERLREISPDALIISDPGVFCIAKEVCPDIDIHVSTQANNVNYMTCLFWKDQGAARVVTARELSLAEIKGICENTPGLEIETFVHGAMCISHSGRCLLSHYFTGRDANLGACTHPCRWRYHLVEETRPGEYLPIEENERGTYIFNSKDLCMIEHIPELIDSGIDSFKIEGRMKTALYVASVIRAYRMAIDDCFESEDKYRNNLDIYKEEVKKCTYRQFTTGFFFGNTTHESQIYDANTYDKGAIYVGQVVEGPSSTEGSRNDEGTSEKDGSYIWIVQKNKISIGDEVQIMRPDGNDISVKVSSMINDKNEPIDACPHPGQLFAIKPDGDVAVDAGDVVRMAADREMLNLGAD